MEKELNDAVEETANAFCEVDSLNQPARSFGAGVAGEMLLGNGGAAIGIFASEILLT